MSNLTLVLSSTVLFKNFNGTIQKFQFLIFLLVGYAKDIDFGILYSYDLTIFTGPFIIFIGSSFKFKKTSQHKQSLDSLVGNEAGEKRSKYLQKKNVQAPFDLHH